MSNIIPFENTAALAIYGDADFSLNAAAEEFSSVKFPVISLKNGRFHIKRDGEKTLILRPKSVATDPDEPASYIDMAVLNLQKSKTYYETGYTDGSEAKPDCFSNDGALPDPSAQNPQCDTCALCPNNAWGSGTNEKGEATKGKACSDVLRLAVASPSSLDDPYMLRVPPASLKNFAAMSKIVSDKRIPLNAVVVRFSFDPATTGVIMFQAIGGLDAASFQKAKSLMDSDLVHAITGKKGGHALPAAAAKPALKVVEKVAEPVVDPEAVKKEAAKVAKAKKLAAAKAALAAAEAEDGEAEPAVEAVAEKPAAKAEVKVANSGSFDSDLADLLA